MRLAIYGACLDSVNTEPRWPSNRGITWGRQGGVDWVCESLKCSDISDK